MTGLTLKAALAVLLSVSSVAVANSADRFMFRPPIKAGVLVPAGTVPTTPEEPNVRYNPSASLETLKLVNGTAVPANTKPRILDNFGDITISYTNLPAGLNFDTTTGQISGTPTVSGIFNPKLTLVGKYMGKTVTSSSTSRIEIAEPASATGLKIVQGGLQVKRNHNFQTRMEPVVTGRQSGTGIVSTITFVYTGLPGTIKTTYGSGNNFLTGIALVNGTYNATVEVRETVQKLNASGGWMNVGTYSATTSFPVVVSDTPDSSGRYFRITLGGSGRSVSHGSEIVVLDQDNVNLSAAARARGEYLVATSFYTDSETGLANGIIDEPREVTFCGDAACSVAGAYTRATFIVDMGQVVTPKRIYMQSFAPLSSEGYPLFYSWIYDMYKATAVNIAVLERSTDGVTWDEVDITTNSSRTTVGANVRTQGSFFIQ
jgi:hypothetical protein